MSIYCVMLGFGDHVVRGGFQSSPGREARGPGSGRAFDKVKTGAFGPWLKKNRRAAVFLIRVHPWSKSNSIQFDRGFRGWTRMRGGGR